jgi:hypothetical protein
MLEEWIQRILKVLGAGDQVIAAGGPAATWVLGMFFGVIAAQSLKQVYNGLLPDRWFIFLTRVIAIVAPIAFAHFLADSLNPAWEAAAGFSALGFYHLTLKAVRKWAPWMEVSPVVGAVCPPAAAEQAATQRAADKP